MNAETKATMVSICPECRSGKHRNCDGKAWDSVRDCLTSCACDHLPIGSQP